MNRNTSLLRAGLVMAASFLFLFVPVRADDAPAAVPAKPADAAPAVVSPTPAAAVPAPAAEVVPTKVPETPLHEIGAAPAAQAAAEKAAAAPKPADQDNDNEDNGHHRARWDHNGDDMVAVGDPVAILKGQTAHDNAVAVMDSLTVDGTVDGNAVSVMGPTTINGTVHGNTVAVMGELTLGPSAVVDGNVVCVGGHITKSPTAKVYGNTVPVQLGIAVSNNDASGVSSFWKHCLSVGRPVGFGPHLHLLWFVFLGMALLYFLLVIIFPAGINRCVETLTERPGITLLTGFLAMLGLPVAGILLIATVVGIPVAFLVLPIGTLACVIFGKAAVQVLVGRSIVGSHSHMALAALVGIAVLTASYLIPFVGFALWFLVAFIGFSTALTTLFTPSKEARAAAAAATAAAAAATPVPPVAPPTEGAPLAASGSPEPGQVPPAAAPLAPPLTAAYSEAALPKAGFWIRMAALVIDVVLIAIIFHFPGVFPVALAVYGAVLWRYKGATVGDIIFHLKVVRADGRPMDWMTAIVRALGCFLSFVFIGLGFIWIAFDANKQGWHDKIAGTVMVRHPKAVTLV